MSDIKSGPRLKARVFVTPSFFGLPPDKLSIVNYSSGSRMASAGPKMILVSFQPIKQTKLKYLRLVIKQLKHVVLLNLILDHSSFIPFIGSCLHFPLLKLLRDEWLSFELNLQAFLHLLSEFLFPQRFKLLQHYRFPHEFLYLPSDVVPDVHSLIFFQRNRLPVLNDCDFNRRNEFAGTIHHPFFSRQPHFLILVSELLLC